MSPVPPIGPRELLATADDLLTTSSESLAGRWPVAVALLCRQALEASLQQLWAARAPGVEAATGRAQLLCLPSYLGDDELAARVAVTWFGLSNACHHHAYELAPTAGELATWYSVVEALVRRVEQTARRGGRTSPK